MATRARRRDTDSAERLRALTRRAYLATGGHLELEDEPSIQAREARRREFDEILRGPGVSTGARAGVGTDAGPVSGAGPADPWRAEGPPVPWAGEQADHGPPERVRWRVSVRAAVAAVLVLVALTGVIVVRSLGQVDPATVPLPAAVPPGSVLQPPAGEPPGPAVSDPAVSAGSPAATADGSGQQPATASDAPPADAASAEVVVHVAGAVVEPGVVTVLSGARVADVVERAGGPTADAELGGINLARVVTDGEQVFVPEVGQGTAGAEAGPPPGTSAGTGGAAAGGDAAAVIDLNQADQAALETLPGIGPALAQRILDWRETNGRFHSVDELDEVSGIGPTTMERLRPRVTI